MRPLASWSVRCPAPCRSRCRCNAASCGQNFVHCCRPFSCLSQERRSSQTVQLCSGDWSGRKWCSAARRPHADVWKLIWERFRDIGEEPHIDSVTLCSAHLSQAEQAKLDDAGRVAAAGNGWAVELAEEGARDDPFPTYLVRHVLGSCRNKQHHH